MNRVEYLVALRDEIRNAAESASYLEQRFQNESQYYQASHMRKILAHLDQAFKICNMQIGENTDANNR